MGLRPGPSGATTSGGSGAPTGAAGGDLGGTYPNPTVPGLALKEPILTPTAVKVANYTLAAGELGLANAASPFTFTLPAAPVDGSRAGAKIVLPTSAPSTITVACGGSDTLNRTGGPTSLTLTLAGQAVTLQFVAGSPGYWVITDDDLPLSQLDLRYANLASPALTGTPTVPTAAVDTNTTQAASTAFVVAQAASATPVVDGTGAAGSSTRFARADHVHPTDTSRAALASPTFTGTPAAPTAAALTSTTQLATTAFVTAADTAAKGLPLALTGATAATRYVGGTASGAPASGTFAVRDFVIDQTGKVYVCTVLGTPGTWVQVGAGGTTPTYQRVETGLGLYHHVGVVTVARSMAVSALYASPFFFDKACTVAGIAFKLNTAVASSAVRLGIYQDTGGGRPGTLLSDAGTIATTASGVLELTTSIAIPSAGLYWLAAAQQGGASGITTLGIADGAFANVQWKSGDIANFAPYSGSVCYTHNGTVAGALPGTFSLATNPVSNPVIPNLIPKVS